MTRLIAAMEKISIHTTLLPGQDKQFDAADYSNMEQLTTILKQHRKKVNVTY